MRRRYLTLDDVAAYLSVSTPQVYALVRSGDLPAIKLGGRGVWRVDRGKLDAYLDNPRNETAQWAKAHPLQKDRRRPGRQVALLADQLRSGHFVGLIPFGCHRDRSSWQG